MKSKQKAKKNPPLRTLIATAKTPEELEFYYQAAKRYENASSDTKRKWTKVINLKREQFGLPTIATL